MAVVSPCCCSAAAEATAAAAAETGWPPVEESYVEFNQGQSIIEISCGASFVLPKGEFAAAPPAAAAAAGGVAVEISSAKEKENEENGRKMRCPLSAHFRSIVRCKYENATAASAAAKSGSFG